MRSLGNQACHAPLPVPHLCVLGTPLRDPGLNHPRLEYRALHHRPPHPPHPGQPRRSLCTHTTRREMIQDTMAGRGPSPGEDAAGRGRRLRQQEPLIAAAAALGSAERGVAAVKGEVPAAAAAPLKGEAAVSARPPSTCCAWACAFTLCAQLSSISPVHFPRASSWWPESWRGSLLVPSFDSSFGPPPALPISG